MRIDTPARVVDRGWTENCPFAKSEQALINTDCIGHDANCTVAVDGKPYTVHSNCWQYTDNDLSQSADN